MLQFRLRCRQQQVFRLLASFSVSGIGLAAAIALSPRTCAESQTVTAPPDPRGGHVLLHSRDLEPSATDPYEHRPNYLKTAIALRHWRQPEVVFHVTPDPKDKRTAGEVRALVGRGLDLWKGKIGSKLTLRETNESDTADVEISFVPAGSLSGGRIGETDISFTVPENDIQRATIQLVNGLSADELVQAVAHESGHVLGIQGHSDANSDLMFPYAHLPAEISDRDLNTINVAYYQIDTTKKRPYTRGQKFGSVKSF